MKFDISKIGGMKPSTMQVNQDATVQPELFGEAEDINIPQSILDKYS
jgi:hypothetical protein